MRNGNPYTKNQVLIARQVILAAKFPLVTVEFDNVGYTGFELDFLISAITGTSITPTAQYWDEAAGVWVAQIATAALTTGGRYGLIVDPRVPAAANAVAQHVARRRNRVSIAASALTSVDLACVLTFAP